MIKKTLTLSLFMLLSGFGPAAIAQDAGEDHLGWDEGRASIMKDSISELSEYDGFKSMSPKQLKLFATCVVEKRIQMGKKLGCGWNVHPGSTPQQHFADQYKCFEDGGFGKAERIEHSTFCRTLVDQYFK